MPKLRVTVNVSGLIQHRRRIEESRPRIVEQAAEDAREMAIMGAQLGIYGTEPGLRYVRTERYLESIYATPAPNTSKLGVRVGDSAEYASELEFGARGGLNQEAARQLAEAVGVKANALYLGRSGKNYIAPNPAITRAAVYAALRMAEAYEKLLSGIPTRV